MEQKPLKSGLGWTCIVGALTWRSQETNAQWQINSLLFRCFYFSFLHPVLLYFCLSLCCTSVICLCSFCVLFYSAFRCQVSSKYLVGVQFIFLVLHLTSGSHFCPRKVRTSIFYYHFFVTCGTQHELNCLSYRA